MAVKIPEDDMTSMLKKFLSEASILHEIMKKTCSAFEAIKLEEVPQILKREIAKPNVSEIEIIEKPNIQCKLPKKQRKRDISKVVPLDEDELDQTIKDLLDM